MNQTSMSSDPQAQFIEEAAKRAVHFVPSGMKVNLIVAGTSGLQYHTRKI